MPSRFASIGLVLVGIGAYTLNINTRSQGYFEPIRRIWTDKGVQMTLIGVILSAVIPSFDKVGIEASNPFLWVLSTHIGSTIFIGIIVILLYDNIVEPASNNLKILLVVGLASSLIWVFNPMLTHLHK